MIHGDPVNPTDAIAQLHDIAYYRARSPADRRKADEEAIGKFYQELRESRIPGAYLGLEGLLDKYSVETITGVLYPSTFDGGDPRAMYYAARQSAISKLWHENKATWKAEGKNIQSVFKNSSWRPSTLQRLLTRRFTI